MLQGSLVTTSARVFTPLLGSSWLRDRILAPEITRGSNCAESVRSIQDRWPDIPHAAPSKTQSASDSPVFVFSAGWGSGSTLVQRLILSSDEVFVWGEPLDQAAIIERLTQSLCALRTDWPPDYHFSQNRNQNELAGEWVANLAPPIVQLWQAHRAFMDTWLDPQRPDADGTRFGLKEVRLGIDNAHYLRWLYPQARFVFVYRDLYASYLSCRRQKWLSVWPEYKATPILAFAHHWKYLLSGFLSSWNAVDGYLLKYEDLVSGEYNLQQLTEYLGVRRLDDSLLRNKVGTRVRRKRPLIAAEKWILDAVAGDVRQQAGYC